MASYSVHVYDRCGQMMGGLDGRGYTWGPMATGCGGTLGGSSGDPVPLGARIFDWGIGTATPNITYPNLTDPSGLREPDRR